MSYDDIIEVLAAALLEKADTVGCLEVLDGFSQRPDTEIEVSAPISEEMLALPLDKQEWPEECAPILKDSGAATLGELVEYLNHCAATGKKLNVSEEAAAAMFPALITFCYDAADMPAFADDPLTTINNLSDFVFSAIKAIGAILLGFGIVQIGLALKGHDASQRAQGFMTFFGGVVIYFAKDILDMIL